MEPRRERCIHSQGGLALPELGAVGRTRPCFRTSGLQDRERKILCCRKSPSCGPLSRQRSQASTVTQSVTGLYCGGGEQSQLMLEAVAASPEGSREAPGKRTNMASLHSPPCLAWGPCCGLRPMGAGGAYPELTGKVCMDGRAEGQPRGRPGLRARPRPRGKQSGPLFPETLRG